MKILHLAQGLRNGGVAQVVYDLASDQVSRGAEVEVVSIHSPEYDDEPACNVALVAAVFIIFAFEIFSARTFEKSNARIARSVCTLLYAGFLPSYITSISMLPRSPAHLVTFLVMVFISDSAAWLFGMLFGKNNRGKVAASPNKSIAGFIGAYLGCILVAFLASYLVFPSAFDAFVDFSHKVHHKAIRVLVLGIVVCTASIVGDLAESVFKRSANIKDSGKIILGRGGILDCVDSVFMAAPFYYYLLIQLFYFPSV